MNIATLAKRDAQRFSSNTATGFAQEVTFTAAPESPPVTATVGCTTTRHSLAVSQQGAPYVGVVASVTVAEQLLLDEDYPVHNANGEVNLKGHLVTWADSTGEEKTYIINTFMPDRKLGLIVCECGFYNP